MMDSSKTRCRIYTADVKNFMAFRDWQECIAGTKFTTIPGDAVLDRVSFNHDNRCLDVLVTHDSFAVVGKGEMPPRFPMIDRERQMILRGPGREYRLHAADVIRLIS